MKPAAATTAAVVVCFNPPAGLAQRLAAIAQQVDFVVLWDNASQPAVCVPDELADHKITLLRQEQNLGMAAALNQSLAHAVDQGAHYAVLFDHDSVPLQNMLKHLHQALQPTAQQPVALAAPRIRYALPDIRCRWPQTQGDGPCFKLIYADEMNAPTPVDLAISSGMLLDLAIWQQLGGFDENLFIDLVDTEYCLHARAHGYRVLACPQAQLQHTLGDVDRKNLAGMTMYPTHHSALRHYYINRNRWVLTARYGRHFPGWLAYEWLGAAKLFIKAMLFEPQRWKKLLAMGRGNRHGLRRVIRRKTAQRHVR